MKNSLLLNIFFLFCVQHCWSQGSKFSLNKDWRNTIVVEVYAGASLSFAFGEYIKYQKAFHDVTNANTDISGKIKPIIFFCIGTGLRYIPFKDEKLSNLSVALGFGYLKRGFTSVYETEYHDPDNDITDKAKFTERYSINVLSIPLSFRWGKKWFAEIGLSYDVVLMAKRKHLLSHEVSGSDAYLGGFSTKANEVQRIDPSLIKQGAIHGTFKQVILGGGYNFSNKFTVRLNIHISGATFVSGDNFRNITPQLQVVIPVTSLFNKLLKKEKTKSSN